MTVFAFATCATPGPVNLVATVLGAKHGTKSSLPFILGATLGLSLVILVSGFGVSQILKTNETLADSITLLGSVYLLYLAYLMSGRSSGTETQSGPAKVMGFKQGAVLQLINPKAWLVSMSGLSMYLNTSGSSMLALYILVFFVACFISVFFWVCLGSMISSRLKASHVTVFNRSMAILLSILVLSNLTSMFSAYI